MLSLAFNSSTTSSLILTGMVAGRYAQSFEGWCRMASQNVVMFSLLKDGIPQKWMKSIDIIEMQTL